MVNKAKDGWYAPLAAQFQGMDEPMPLARFAAIEAVLHLLALNAPAADPVKAYVTKPEPHVYFIDGAFRGREEKQGDFDCLSELGRYLDTLMTCKDSAEIAKTLYAPFYKAYRKDIPYES